MENDPRIPSGEWSGFYLESHRFKRGWMHLYLTFENGQIKGEGTDYVGPWTASGTYDTDSGQCHWKKQYLGKHDVLYSGRMSETGIQGQWKIVIATGPFHIWPNAQRELTELYLREELDVPPPSINLEPQSDVAFL